MAKAVVLLNLGAPNALDEVPHFLYNLFSDPAIINWPSPFRQMLAKFISVMRSKKAKQIYEKIGGKSPLLENTKQQADALQEALGKDYKIFICMRYNYPRLKDVYKELKAEQWDEVLLLPLYPQCSSTTIGSSVNEWLDTDLHVKNLGCYFKHPLFVQAHQNLINQAIRKVSPPRRILFSAHGLPQKIVDAGDPYQSHVEQGASRIMQDILEDWAVCYQSKVGPTRWLEPSIQHELKRAANDKVNVIVVPIAFVSEHSETLVELDIDYAEIAKELGIRNYYRVQTLNTHPLFIETLASIVRKGRDCVCPLRGI